MWILLTIIFKSLIYKALSGQPETGELPEEVVVQYYKTAILPCRVTNVGKPATVSWKVEGNSSPLTVGKQIVSSDSRISIHNGDLGNWDMRIKFVKFTDEKEYQCIALTYPIRILRKIRLNVIHPPRITRLYVTKPKPKVTEGDNVTLTCQWQSEILVNITWKHGDDILPEKHLRLELVRVSQAQSGTYTCMVDNGVSPLVSESVQLSVFALPHPPRVNVTAVTNTSVSFVVAIVVNDPKSRPDVVNVMTVFQTDEGILKYEQDYYMPGDSDNRTVRIDGLGPLTSYSFEFRAVSTIGESAPYVINITTPEQGQPVVDTSPLNVTVKAGLDIQLPCNIQNLGFNRVYWWSPGDIVIFVDTRRISADRRLSLPFQYDTDWSLQISNVKLRDAGEYKCIVDTQPMIQKRINLIVYVAPTILPTLSSNNVTVEENDTVELICQFTGSPVPSIVWYRVYTNERDDQDILEMMGEGSGVLVIRDITREFAGKYTCVASNGIAPDGKHDIYVQVDFPPEVTAITKRVGQTLGRQTMLECSAVGSPIPSVRWFKGTSRLEDNYKYKLTLYEELDSTVTSSLLIQDLQVDDFTEYTCEADNYFQSASDNITLFTIGEPAIDRSVSTSRISVLEYQEFDLNCEATGTPTPRVNWYKLDNNNEIERDIGPGTTTFRNVRREDQGHYRCRAWNAIGEDTLDAFIEVQFPPTVNIASSILKSKIGDDVSVTCTSSGNPEPQIEWRHSARLDRTLNHKMTKSKISEYTIASTLEISNIDEDDLGVYVCLAGNILGTFSSKVSLNGVLDTTADMTSSSPATPQELSDSNNLKEPITEIQQDTATTESQQGTTSTEKTSLGGTMKPTISKTTMGYNIMASESPVIGENINGADAIRCWGLHFGLAIFLVMAYYLR